MATGGNGAAHRKLRREAARKGKTLRPQALEFAKRVIVFTAFPRERFAPEAVLDWCRPGRQGKLSTALLTEKLIAHASAVSPWGYDLPVPPHAEPAAPAGRAAFSGRSEH